MAEQTGVVRINGDLIQERAKARGWDTYGKFAVGAGIHRQTALIMWTGQATRADLESLRRVATALACTVDDLLIGGGLVE